MNPNIGFVVRQMKRVENPTTADEVMTNLVVDFRDAENSTPQDFLEFVHALGKANKINFTNKWNVKGTTKDGVDLAAWKPHQIHFTLDLHGVGSMPMQIMVASPMDAMFFGSTLTMIHEFGLAVIRELSVREASKEDATRFAKQVNRKQEFNHRDMRH